MSTDRKNPRKQSYAKVILDGDLPAYIRDLSPDGFKVYSPVPLPYDQGSVISCRIIPSDLEDFEVEGEVRWNRQDSNGNEILGVKITSYTDQDSEKLFARLNEQFSQN
ncbi:MAG: PilZ domain-containing protein [Spirochaetales bacterium]|nr:PilZ domain-containing protein [Spirochaetales bacterium]